MKKALIPLLLCLIVVGVAGAEDDPKGKIVFEDEYHDFGRAVEGDILTHRFKFSNVGRGVTTLTGIKSSCGCTVATATLKPYQAGEESTLTVTVDTKDKKGFITKTVEVLLENDEREKVAVVMTVELMPPPHPAVDAGMVVTKDAQCKKCHLETGVGFEEGFLYHRVCKQCHGARGKGASAQGFTAGAWQESVNDDFIKKAIREGVEEKKMPSFVDGVTPPLTDAQVDSLVSYIRTLRGK